MKKHPFTYELKNATTGTAEIQIYGYIGKWDEVDYPRFQKIFRDTLASNKQVTLRIHSGGGSVHEGLAIYDLIRSSDAQVTVIVEGMAASMASIIALAGDTIQMTENAFFMMHAVSGGCWGNKSEMQSYIEQIEGCEQRLKNIYKERTNADEATINNWLDSGQDYWLDSAKCLELSICDEVIKPTKTRNLDKQNVYNKTPEQAWQSIAACLSENPIINKTDVTMKKESLFLMLATFGMAGTLTATSGDEDFQKQLEAVLAKAKKADELQAQISALKLQEVEKVKAQIAQAVTVGKIPGSEKAQWEKDAEASPEMVMRILGKLPAMPNPNASLQRENKGVEASHELLKGRENWTFSQWQEKDPKGLMRLEKEAKDEFEKLFNQEYNK